MRTIGFREGLLRYKRDRIGLLEELGESCESIVLSALGPLKLVVITDAALTREVLVKHAAKLSKGPAVRKFAPNILGRGLLTAEDPLHRRNRKIIAPKMQRKAVDRYGQEMLDLCWETLDRWREHEPTDFGEEMVHLTMAIAAQTMFGTRVDGVVDTVSEALTVANHYIIEEATSLLHIPLSLPTPGNLRLKKSRETLDEVVYGMIEEHRANPLEQNDVLAALLAARDEEGESLSDEQVRDEVVTFFLAGHETTANALAWAYLLLARNPGVAAKLQHEVDTLIDGPLRPEDAGRLGYAKQVFQEVLRLFPPSYIVGRECTESFELQGHTIDKGVYILVNNFGCHRRPDYFDAPLSFRPERFEGEPAWPQHAYMPYGAGPRVCIGNHFANLEGVLILAMLARHIDFPNRNYSLETEPLITLRPRDGIPFEVQWRS